MLTVVWSGSAWWVRHGGRWLLPEFATEAEAWEWADANVDDQVFGGPNTHSPPLEYRPRETTH